jgi:hypothetical protein
MSRASQTPRAAVKGLVQGAPIFAANDTIAAHCDPCSCWCSNTIRTARSRTDGEYLLDVLDMTSSSQGLEPAIFPERSRPTSRGHATRIICRSRWHLHELDPGWEPARSLARPRALNKVCARLEGFEGLVARLAPDLADRCRALSAEIANIEVLVEQLAPSPLAICGCGPLTAAKILGETVGVQRLRSKQCLRPPQRAAPRPAWSSNKSRHRLNRASNRQLNTALHRIALTQAHWHLEARALLAPAQGTPPRGTRDPERAQTPALSAQTSSTAPSSPTWSPRSPTPLDRGARDSPSIGQPLGRHSEQLIESERYDVLSSRRFGAGPVSRPGCFTNVGSSREKGLDRCVLASA